MKKELQPTTQILLHQGAEAGGVLRKVESEVYRADSQMIHDPPLHKAMMIQRAPHM